MEIASNTTATVWILNEFSEQFNLKVKTVLHLALSPQKTKHFPYLGFVVSVMKKENFSISVRYDSITTVKEQQFDTFRNISPEIVISKTLLLQAATVHKHWQKFLKIPVYDHSFVVKHCWKSVIFSLCKKKFSTQFQPKHLHDPVDLTILSLFCTRRPPFQQNVVKISRQRFLPMTWCP